MYQLGNEHDGDWHTLRMTSNEDEISLLDVVNPIEQELPQGIYALCNSSLALKCNLLNLRRVTTRRRPIFDGGRSSVGKAD